MTAIGEKQTFRYTALNVRFRQDRTFAPSDVIGWF
jgi:hypothetical protein